MRSLQNKTSGHKTSGQKTTGAATARNQHRTLEIALWAISAACFASLAGIGAAAAVAHSQAQAIFTSPVPAQSASQPVSSATAQSPETAQVIGRIEIPALHVSVPITSGVETSSLLTGVGHIDGTALPGGLGTTVLAGHRDTYLRPLEHIAKGMQILLTNHTGTYRYIVDRWEIVLPENVESVSMQSRPELALVTCYPFHYIGAAPKRFIVHAYLESLIPDTHN